MDVDVAVLGGGPGGYTAAIRAAQLGAKVACIEQEPELGGTCLRVGCIPTKAWVQTAYALREVEESFAKFGVQVSGARLDFAASNVWKAGVVHQMTSGVASLFKANGVEWVKGTGRFTSANTIAVEGGEDVNFKQAVIATGSFPLRPPIPGLDSPRCVDSTGLLAQEQVPSRLVILGGGIIGCEFASIFSRFGSEVTIVEMLDSLIPQEDADASKELAKQFKKRDIALELGKQCTRVDDDGSQLTVHYGDGETVQADLMLVAVGRGPVVEGPRARGDRRAVRQAEGHRRRRAPPHDRVRTSMRSATAPATGSSRTRRSARARSQRRTRAATTRPSTTARCRGRSTPIRRSRRSASPRPRRASSTATTSPSGRFPWVANARAVMQDETIGWVKSIHETRYGELLGLVMVGPHVTDMIEAGVVAIDAEATVETVADGMAPHPTLSEAIKEAGLVALGRAIHIPNRKPRASAQV